MPGRFLSTDPHIKITIFLGDHSCSLWYWSTWMHPMPPFLGEHQWTPRGRGNFWFMVSCVTIWTGTRLPKGSCVDCLFPNSWCCSWEVLGMLRDEFLLNKIGHRRRGFGSHLFSPVYSFSGFCLLFTRRGRKPFHSLPSHAHGSCPGGGHHCGPGVGVGNKWPWIELSETMSKTQPSTLRLLLSGSLVTERWKAVGALDGSCS